MQQQQQEEGGGGGGRRRSKHESVWKCATQRPTFGGGRFFRPKKAGFGGLLQANPATSPGFWNCLHCNLSSSPIHLSAAAAAMSKVKRRRRIIISQNTSGTHTLISFIRQACRGQEGGRAGAKTLVPWRQGFRHRAMNECIGLVRPNPRGRLLHTSSVM